jgi:hypothetical protein
MVKKVLGFVGFGVVGYAAGFFFHQLTALSPAEACNT